VAARPAVDRAGGRSAGAGLTRMRLLARHPVCTKSSGERAVARQRLYVRRPKLWDPHSPDLYAAHVTLACQDGEAVKVTPG